MELQFFFGNLTYLRHEAGSRERYLVKTQPHTFRRVKNADRLPYIIIISQRFTHPHEYNIHHPYPFFALLWLCHLRAKTALEKQNLLNYLSHAQVTYKPLLSGRAKLTADSATNLAGNANSAPFTSGAGIAKKHQGGLNSIIICQSEKNFAGLPVNSSQLLYQF